MNLFSSETSMLTLITLMSTTVDILSFYKHLHNELLKVKNTLNIEALIYVIFQKYHKFSVT